VRTDAYGILKDRALRTWKPVGTVTESLCVSDAVSGAVAHKDRVGVGPSAAGRPKAAFPIDYPQEAATTPDGERMTAASSRSLAESSISTAARMAWSMTPWSAMLTGSVKRAATSMTLVTEMAHESW